MVGLQLVLKKNTANLMMPYSLWGSLWLRGSLGRRGVMTDIASLLPDRTVARGIGRDLFLASLQACHVIPGTSVGEDVVGVQQHPELKVLPRCF